MPIMHNNRNADCRQRHLYRWAGGNRNQEIRHEAFRRQSPHSKPTQGVDAVPQASIWCLLHLCHFLHATGLLAWRRFWRAFNFSDERHGSEDSRSLTWARIDGKPAMDQIYPFLHAHQA